MAGIKLVSVNIERSKHLDRVIPFLLSIHPDVICMQELAEEDIARMEQVLGMRSVFAPSGLHPDSGKDSIIGVGIFGREFSGTDIRYYAGSESEARTCRAEVFLHNALVSCEFVQDEKTYRIATTHFAWTPDGNASDVQRKDLAQLFSVLGAYDSLVLCGDFNAPRGREIFTEIAERYQDNIPQEYTTSIDGNLHRAGPLPLMVDGLFSTPEYLVSNVRLQDGVSDHMAIVARVEKR